MQTYDLVVIGSGPAGQRAAIQGAKLGKRVAIVEKREHPIVLGVRQRIVLVAMTLGTLHGEAEHRLADRVHPVVHRFHPELLRIDAALLVRHRVAQEASRDLVVLRRRGQ